MVEEIKVILVVCLEWTMWSLQSLVIIAISLGEIVLGRH